MPLLDFNSLVICNYEKSPELLFDMMSHFKEFGIKHFIITYFIDYKNTTENKIINDYKDFKHLLSSIHVRGTDFKIAPVILIRQGTLKNSFIKRLKMYGTNLIFVSTPTFFNDRYWINSSLNHLVFEKKLLPIFTSFEKNLMICQNSFTKSLFKANNAMFCLDLNFIINPNYEHFIHQSVTTHTTIIPCVSHGIYNYKNILPKFNTFRNRIGDIAYLKICKHINQSCHRLWCK